MIKEVEYKEQYRVFPIVDYINIALLYRNLCPT